MNLSPEDQLIESLAGFRDSPYEFVMFSFPWGEPGTQLANKTGPEPWQEKFLKSIKSHLSFDKALKAATTSGHGVGKSALVAWLTWWGISTFVGTRGVVTANTERQLKTKTWVEVQKWYNMFIGRSLFSCGATSINSVDPEYEKIWRIDMIPWSDKNTEAFAGLHNKGSRILIIFDEGSSIPDIIWEVTQGALTDSDTQILWLVFGNPTMNTGRFRGCFEGPMSKDWLNFKVDSRTVSLTNKTEIAAWVEAWGEDSDYIRVRVRGEFPRVGALEFIPRDLCEQARRRVTVDVNEFDPLILGVDVARFGDDKTVICLRRGRDARSLKWIVYQGVDLMETAARVSALVNEHTPEAVFVDEGGLGAGVVDRLRQLNVSCIGVNFGAASSQLATDAKYANKRAEMWGLMREWLPGAIIPDEDALMEELNGPTYSLTERNEIRLERKADMKRRGVASPDHADALALTFAYPVAANPFGLVKKATYISEYDPLLELA